MVCVTGMTGYGVCDRYGSYSVCDRYGKLWCV